MGIVWKYGENVNTDLIFPGQHTYTIKEPDEIAAHALANLDPMFAPGAHPGDVIVAGRNWGNGSSREQAVTCLKYKGIAAVIARSFARIYYRNGINQGLRLLICPQVVEAAQTGDTIKIDLNNSLIWLNGRKYEFPPFSPAALDILAAGGLIPHIRQKLGPAKEPQEGSP